MLELRLWEATKFSAFKIPFAGKQSQSAVPLDPFLIGLRSSTDPDVHRILHLDIQQYTVTAY